MYSMQIKLLGLTCRVEIIVISIIVGILLGTHLFCSCTKVSAKEMTKEIENRINGIINDVGGRIKEGFALANAAPTTYKMGKGVPDSYDSNRLESISQNLGTHIGPKCLCLRDKCSFLPITLLVLIAVFLHKVE